MNLVQAYVFILGRTWRSRAVWVGGLSENVRGI